MTNVFIVQHVHDLGEGIEDVKLIGVYSSPESAEQAVERLRTAPGFRDELDGFSVDSYKMDKDHWVEGFVILSGDAEQANTE